MGLLDISSKVLTTYKADVADHKAKIKELTGEQKELAKAELEASKARNKQLEDWKIGIEKAGVAIGAFTLAFSAAEGGLSAFAEHNRQVSAAAGVDIKALSDVAGGLISQTKLLTFAAAENHGQWALNQEQMQDVIEAWTVLRAEGNDADQALQDLTKSLKENKTEGLEKYGIAVRDATGEVDKHRAILEALQKKYQDFHGAIDTSTDDIDRLKISFSDIKDDIEIGFGAAIHGATSGLRSFLDTLAGGNSVWSEARREQSEYVNSMEHVVAVQNAEINTMLVLKQLGAVSSADISRLLKQEDAQLSAVASFTNSAGDLDVKIQKILAQYKGRGSSSRGGRASSVGAPTELDFSINAESFGSGDIAGDRSGFLTSDIAMSDEAAGRQREIEANRRALLTAAGRYGAFQEGENHSWLEGVFGKLDEFDAYQSALSSLTDSMQSAYQAWASGATSAGDAFKKAIGAGIAAMGANMFVHGLSESAMAIADLFVNPAAAASHAAAAAEFFAGAAAAGVISRQFGGGVAQLPSGGSGGGGAGAGASPGSAGAVNDHRTPLGAGGNYLIMVNDEFAEDTPQRRSKRAYDALQTAKRRGGDGEGLRWS